MKKMIYLKIALLTIFVSLLFNVRTVEAQTPTYPTWNVTVVPVCPSGMVQTQPLRMFRIIWPQTQGSNDFDCVNDNSSTSKHSETITPKNIINNMQGIYVGLEDPIRDGQNANCSEGVSIEPSSIAPVVTVIRQGNNPPTGDFVNFAQYMNPYNWMVRWDWNRLIGGDYTINFNLPASMCEAVSTLTPGPSCPKKALGDANCDGKIDDADYEIWRQEFTGASTDKTADFDQDGSVTIVDYEIWRQGFINSQVGPTDTPTPTTNPTCTNSTTLTDCNNVGCAWYAQCNKCANGGTSLELVCPPSPTTNPTCTNSTTLTDCNNAGCAWYAQCNKCANGGTSLELVCPPLTATPTPTPTPTVTPTTILKANGLSCTLASECSGGFCSGGICNNARCGITGSTCNTARPTCCTQFLCSPTTGKCIPNTQVNL